MRGATYTRVATWPDKEVLVERVGVVGCGLMGSGIAEVTARAGADVVVIEVDREALAAGQERVERSLSRATAAGKLSDDDAATVRANLSYSTDYTRLSDRHIVIEAVAEDEAIKTEVFATLDEVVSDPDAVLATNTSSIPIIKLAMATSRP